MNENEKKWGLIANRDKKDRDSSSSSSVLIDEIVLSWVKQRGSKLKILDYGAGTGIQSRMISEYAEQITAYEPTKEMHEILSELTQPINYPNIRITNNVTHANNLRNIDIIVCSRVFEHISDIDEVLTNFSTILKPKGTLLLSLSHPVKFSGDWVKDQEGNYDFYKIYDYFQEGLTLRSRDDSAGNKQMERITAYHRTISSYLNSIIKAGFYISKVMEPTPKDSVKERLPKLYNRLIRIPNCLVLYCVNKH